MDRHNRAQRGIVQELGGSSCKGTQYNLSEVVDLGVLLVYFLPRAVSGESGTGFRDFLKAATKDWRTHRGSYSERFLASCYQLQSLR
jgi:hypothetical protein